MTSKLNFLLVILIMATLGVIAYFGWRLWSEPVSLSVTVTENALPSALVDTRTPAQRDVAREKDVRTIDAAVRAWAKDHRGSYPESDFKNPCSGVRYCLKGVNMKDGAQTYLAPIPQDPPHYLDYHYRADNKNHTYCVRMPLALETKQGMIFQCTQERCEAVPFAEACDD